MNSNKVPPLEVRLRVLSAVDYAPGNSIRERIKQVSQRTFKDEQTVAKLNKIKQSKKQEINHD